MNIFEMAEANANVKGKKGAEKPTIRVTSDCFSDQFTGDKDAKKKSVDASNEFELRMARLIKDEEELAILEARVEEDKTYFKQFGLKFYANLVRDAGARISSFVLRSMRYGKDGVSESVSKMVTVKDAYTAIDETRYNELVKKYGEDIAKKDITYKLDTALVEKYGKALSEAIMSCEAIPIADRAKLISASSKYTVASGAIEKLHTTYRDRIEEVIEDIRPILSIK